MPMKKKQDLQVERGGERKRVVHNHRPSARNSLPHAEPINVNVGCGSNVVEGYINIDNFENNGNNAFLKGDILDLPLESNSIDYIICDQVLEHLSMADVPIALYNIRRVLKKGGRAVVIVPDFEDMVRQWLDAKLDATFTPMRYQYFSEVIYGNQEHEGEYHKTPMSPRYLHELFRMAGLAKNTITFWPANGPIPDFPGMRPYPQGAVLRNAQLVVDVIKQ